jgi:hypothetical protein
MKTFKYILIAILSGLVFLNIEAQEIGKVLSPKPNDTILNGELFIVVDVDPKLNIDPSKLNLTIDKLSYSTLVKFTNNKVSALVLRPLSQGKHEILLTLDLGDREYLSEKWVFYTYSENKMKRKYPGQLKKKGENKKDFEINGSVSFDARTTELTGDGAYLRQEPPQSQHLRANATIRYKKLQIPFKFYYTNHENPLLPPRNRLKIGIKGNKAGILFGDVNPSYDRLIQNGSRIRGGEAYVKLRNTKLSVAYGEVNRRTEGQLSYWDINQGFQPVNMQPDSTYVLPGTYKRNLFAFNLESSPANSQNKFRFTIMRSTDDVTSIQFGGPAQQNIAMSFNSVVAGRENRYSIDMGAAISATTKDIRRGAVDPEEFQSTFKKELRVDPLGWEDVFIVNSTTVPLTTKNASFLAWYVNGRFNILKQQISINLRRLGASFESFGNPYLQNDRRELMFRDNIGFWKRNINLNLQYRYMEDNLSRIKSISNTTQMIGANLSLTFGKKSPRITGGYRVYIRESKLLEQPENARENIVTNYSTGVNYGFKTGEFSHGLNVVFNRNIRESNQNNTSGNTNDNINFNINETFPFGLSLSVQFNHLLLANDTTDLTEQQTLGFRISYSTKNKKIKVSAGGRKISAKESEFNPESTRQIADITIQYKVFKNASIKLVLGNSTYTEPFTNKRNYNENWGQLGLRYNLR